MEHGVGMRDLCNPTKVSMIMKAWMPRPKQLQPRHTTLSNLPWLQQHCHTWDYQSHRCHRSHQMDQWESVLFGCSVSSGTEAIQASSALSCKKSRKQIKLRGNRIQIICRTNSFIVLSVDLAHCLPSARTLIHKTEHSKNNQQNHHHNGYDDASNTGFGYFPPWK